MSRARSSSLLALIFAAACGARPTVSPAPVAAVAWPDELPFRTLAPRPTSPAISAADLMTRLYQLADDSMQGRESGKLGNFKGTTYIGAEFARDGLTPMGDSGTFFQTIGLAVGSFDTTLTLSGAGTPFTPWHDFVPVAPINPATAHADFAGSDIPTVFAGIWGDSTSTVSAADLRGKVAVFLAPDSGKRANFWSVPEPRAVEALIVAVVPADSIPGAYVNFFSGHREAIRPAEPPAAGPLALFLSPAAVVQLFGHPVDSLKAGVTGRTVSGAVHYSYRPTDYPARNVVALLPGSDPALRGEYVVISAHNDHLGFGKPVDHDSLRAFNRVMRPWGANNRPGAPTADQWAQIRTLLDSARVRRHGLIRVDSVYNGADDDGSGTVILLEIAEELAHRTERPRRSILFVSHTGEEKGLLGSQWFTDHSTVPRDSIVTALNMDMEGKGRSTDMNGSPASIQMIGSYRLSTDLGKLIDSLNGQRTEPMAIDYTYDAHGQPLNRYCRSDHFMYARYGIPITYFSLGYAIDYHQLTDEPQYIDYEHGAKVGRFVRDIALAVANRPDRPKVDGPIQDPKQPCRQ